MGRQRGAHPQNQRSTDDVRVLTGAVSTEPRSPGPPGSQHAAAHPGTFAGTTEGCDWTKASQVGWWIPAPGRSSGGPEPKTALPPNRVENAFLCSVSTDPFQRVAALMSSRAPSKAYPSQVLEFVSTERSCPVHPRSRSIRRPSIHSPDDVSTGMAAARSVPPRGELRVFYAGWRLGVHSQSG